MFKGGSRNVATIFSMVFILASVGTVNGGSFTEVRSNFHKYYALDAINKKVWLVGEKGVIIHGTLGAEDWSIQESGTMESLNEVDFVNQKYGFAVGANGTILRTETGGETWLTVKSPKSRNLLTAFAINENVFWCAGDYGTILQSSDGGNTWEDRSLKKRSIYRTEPVDIVLNDIFFTSPDIGWIVGEGGTILKTVDSGKSWEYRDLEDGGTDYLFSIQFLGDKGVITAACGKAYQTSDGGERWDQIPVTEKCINLYDAILMKDSALIVGERGSILERSLDSSLSGPTEDISFSLGWLIKIKQIKIATYLTCGNYGTVFFTENAGKSWSPLK